MGKQRKILPATDGLPMRQVGKWTLEKNERLRKYIDASKGARAGWLGPGKAGATYIELYTGYGRGFIQDGEGSPIEEIDGSPIVALAAARDAATQFSEVHLGDFDQTALSAALTRVDRSFPSVPRFPYPSEASVAARQVVSTVDCYGLNLAFLDPFSLRSLSFDVIEALAKLRRIDIIIHVSAQDLNRNLRLAFTSPNETHALDVFAPGWRQAVNEKQKDLRVRMQVLDHWAQLVKKLGLEVFTNQMELVSGGNRQPLYWLALAARNPLAHHLWNEIRHIDLQRELF
jgi:three-Cys-motif partner protein